MYTDRYGRLPNKGKFLALQSFLAEGSLRLHTSVRLYEVKYDNAQYRVLTHTAKVTCMKMSHEVMLIGAMS